MNYGTFLPLSVESVVENDFPESRYRNKFLVEAMRNVKMVETEGGGIRKLYMQQKKRFFPMPKLQISNRSGMPLPARSPKSSRPNIFMMVAFRA